MNFRKSGDGGILEQDLNLLHQLENSNNKPGNSLIKHKMNHGNLKIQSLS